MDWLLTLQGYINSEQALRDMESERVSERDLIFSGVYPQYEVLGGIPRRFGYSTETAALELIYLDDTYSSVRERHTGNRVCKLVNKCKIFNACKRHKYIDTND